MIRNALSVALTISIVPLLLKKSSFFINKDKKLAYAAWLLLPSYERKEFFVSDYVTDSHLIPFFRKIQIDWKPRFYNQRMFNETVSHYLNEIGKKRFRYSPEYIQEKQKYISIPSFVFDKGFSVISNITNCLAHDTSYLDCIDEKYRQTYKFRSIACIPIIAENRKLAVLYLASNAKFGFRSRSIKPLEILGKILSYIVVFGAHRGLLGPLSLSIFEEAPRFNNDKTIN